MHKLNQIIAIAPMLAWTDRHCRYFHRILTKHALLYTEMITTGAILHGDRERLLQYNPEEHPLALQLGGSDPKQLAECAKIGADFGYDEINLNVGCPSNRVQAGQFGAYLMLEPKLVAECVAAMQSTVPVSIKTRLGIIDQDSYEKLYNFIKLVAAAGCSKFIIHARSVNLAKSPKDNRRIPKLDYDKVYKLKQDFPRLTIIINGGIKTYAQIKAQLQHVDGVMLGREAYHNPYFLAEIDQRFYGETQKPLSREEVLEAFIPYIESKTAKGVKLSQITRHILGLYKGIPHARNWRQQLSENPETVFIRTTSAVVEV